MSYVKRYLKLLGIIGITASGVLGVPAVKKEDSEDHVRQAQDESDIIGANEGITQGDYFALRSMDEYISRYTWLTEIVDADEHNGKFWIKVRFKDEGNGIIALYGTRNDGVEFIVRVPAVEQQIIGTRNNARILDTAFNMLREQLNGCLSQETI